jgi:5'-nucleotidase
LGVVLVDQDGVLADFEQGLLDSFRARHPGAPFIALADRRGFYAREQYPAQWAKAIDTIVRSEGFYRDLPAIEYASAALAEMLTAGHDVFLCTSPLTGSRWCLPEKLAWIERHLGPAWLRRTIITPDKTLVGDRLKPCVLVDDRPAITGVASPPWTQVLFDAPYNRGAHGPRLSSWADWRTVIEPVLASQKRDGNGHPR